MDKFKAIKEAAEKLIWCVEETGGNKWDTADVEDYINKISISVKYLTPFAVEYLSDEEFIKDYMDRFDCDFIEAQARACYGIALESRVFSQKMYFSETAVITA